MLGDRKNNPRTPLLNRERLFAKSTARGIRPPVSQDGRVMWAIPTHPKLIEKIKMYSLLQEYPHLTKAEIQELNAISDTSRIKSEIEFEIGTRCVDECICFISCIWALAACPISSVNLLAEYCSKEPPLDKNAVFYDELESKATKNPYVNSSACCNPPAGVRYMFFEIEKHLEKIALLQNRLDSLEQQGPTLQSM